MFEGLFQPMHLLVIIGLALLVFRPQRSYLSLEEAWEMGCGDSKRL